VIYTYVIVSRDSLLNVRCNYTAALAVLAYHRKSQPAALVLETCTERGQCTETMVVDFDAPIPATPN
jgi:hypothetical protein